MRLLSIDDLIPDMILAKSLFNSNGDILIKGGTALSDIYISRLKAHNFTSVYIDDDLSRGITIRDIIADETRTKLVSSIKNIFIAAENKDTSQLGDSLPDLNVMINSVIDSVISNRNNSVNLLDIKNYDLYTFQHSVNVAVLSAVLGVALSMNRKELYALSLAALFHDIGKIKVPLTILNKKGRLTPDEFEIMKKHSLYGFQLAKARLPVSIKAYMGILQHHEKYDGSGYPSNRIGQEITLFARIIAVADVYDAITSKRPYHDPILPSEAMEFIMSNSSIHFDPEIVNIFSRKVAIYPLGTVVILSNGLKGIVIENYQDATTRPKIRVIDDNNSSVSVVLDLRNDINVMNVTIVDIVR